MAYRMTLVKALGVLALVVLAMRIGAAQNKPIITAEHPAVGAWFGRGVQLCPQGAAPSACVNGFPAVALMVAVTLTGDGLFVANDSLSLGGAPFGPHTSEHGTWSPTSSTELLADDIFLAPPFPPAADNVALFRARWQGQVINGDTIVGWFNGYPQPNVPVLWTRLLDNEFPAFPAQANGVLTAPPNNFVKDPTLCRTPGCPLVIKFTLKRLAR
jgi:hypothetical protein